MARLSSMDRVCSAALMVLPPGVFITTTPRAVAASTSTLSTPTPARPTTLSRGAAAKRSAVTRLALRTMRASASRHRSFNASGESLFCATTSKPAVCRIRSTPFWARLSVTRTRIRETGRSA